MRPIVLALAALLVAGVGPADAQTSAFDGRWSVVLTCPPHIDDDDDAKGYTHRFAGTVTAGELSATHGTEGEPGWHHLHGRIRADGQAALRLDGLVNNPRHAINNAPRGKAYSYRVRARFEGSSGAGARLTGRECSLSFSR